MNEDPSLNDGELDKELCEMLRGVEGRLQEQGARAQASAANAVLALLGVADISEMNDAQRARMVEQVFKFACYSLAGMPIVQNAIAAAHGLTKEQALAAVPRALGLLFGLDPEPLIRVMLGHDQAADGSVR